MTIGLAGGFGYLLHILGYLCSVDQRNEMKWYTKQKINGQRY